MLQTKDKQIDSFNFDVTGLNDTETIDCLITEIMRRGGRGFKPQEISNIVWALAKSDIYRQDFMEVGFIFVPYFCKWRGPRM